MPVSWRPVLSSGGSSSTVTANVAPAGYSGGVVYVVNLPPIIFVTNTTHTGALGGFTGANAICESANAIPAAYSTARMHFVAMLAGNTVGTTLGTTYYNTHTSGYQAIAPATTKYLTGNANGSIGITNNLAGPGSIKGSGANSTAWTGAGPNNCNGWTSENPAALGMVGTTESLDSNYWNFGTTFCNNQRALYCVSTTLAPSSTTAIFTATVTGSEFRSGDGITAASAFIESTTGPATVSVTYTNVGSVTATGFTTSAFSLPPDWSVTRGCNGSTPIAKDASCTDVYTLTPAPAGTAETYAFDLVAATAKWTDSAGSISNVTIIPTGYNANGTVYASYLPPIIFVTKTATTGNIQGITGANNICNNDPYIPPLYKGLVTFVAMLAGNPATTNGVTYYQSLNSPASGGANPTAVVLAMATGGYLTASGIISPTLPVALGIPTTAWTGAGPGGVGNNCTGWTSTTGQGAYGNPQGITSTWWYAAATRNCSVLTQLYCVSQ